MVDLESIDLFWTYSNVSFQQEYLQAFGIETERILPAKRLSYWEAQELVYTSSSTRHAESIEFLRQVAEERFGVHLHRPKNRRIYTSRRDAAGRHVVNNDEVLDCLQPLGFEEVVLTTMTVKDQMQLFADAEFIISPHGAGLSNGIFSQPGTKVIELFSPKLVVSSLYHQLTSANLNYAFLVGEENDQISEGFRKFQEPMEISVAKLRDLISRLG